MLVGERVNFRLSDSLEESVMLPQIGVQKIRNILHSYQLEMPALYDMHSEGDEVVVALDPVNESDESKFLYMIYCLNENATGYDFYAEVVTEQEVIDILNTEDDTEEDS